MYMQRAIALVLGSLLICGTGWAGDELNSEIDSLQMQVKPAPHTQQLRKQKRPARKYQAARTVTNPQVVLRQDTLVADNSGPGAPPASPRVPVYSPPPPPAQQAPVPVPYEDNSVPEAQTAPPQNNDYADNSYNPEASTSRMALRPVDETPRQDGFLFRVSLAPAVSISTFDGSMSSQVIPSGVTNPYNTSPAVNLLTDLNLLGTDKFVLQTGADFIQAGSQTGYVVEPWLTNFSYNEKVSLSYAGIPIDAKWMARGEHVSSFFAKLGVNPVFLVSHQYTTYAGYNEEFRFGGYGTMDVLLTGGVGYSVKLGKNYSLDVDIEMYQGTIPVLSTYNVFNVGGTAGIGLSYLL